MKRVFVITVLLFAAAALVWRAVQQPSERSTETESQVETLESESRAVNPILPDEASEEATTTLVDEEGVTERIARDLASLTEEEKRLKPDGMPLFEWLNFVADHRIKTSRNGEITFFGKVISETGTPLPGVQVNASIIYAEPSLAKAVMEGDVPRQKTITLVTDGDGNFQIGELVGSTVHISGFSKDGYEIATDRKAWGYSFIPDRSRLHEPDPENPEIFTMKKVE